VARINSGKELRKLVAKRKATKSSGDEGTVETIFVSILCFGPQ